MPGHANTVSVMDVAQDVAAHDAAGLDALGARELHVVLAAGLDHAGGGQAQHQRDVGQRQVDGRHDQVRPAVGRQDGQAHAQHSDGVAAPGGGQPSQPDGEQQDQHHALPEVRQRKAQHGRRHDAAAQVVVAVQAGDEPQRDADHTGQHDGHEDELEGGGDALHDQFDRGDAVHEGRAQVTVQRAPQESGVLLPHGQVQAQAGDHRLAGGLAGFGADQQFDRVAHGVHREEDHDRNGQQHEQTLYQSA
ncbi:hypothetical protein G6F22_014823 [Rhizopus arrhizus]|nr:hypothetical protein G6F22_014823 [Rhizopus arrhizus]